VKKRTRTYRFEELNIDLAHIEEVIGYKTEESPGTVSGLIEKALSDCGNIKGIRSEYVIYRDVSTDPKTASLEVEGVEFKTGKIIHGQIRKAEHLAVFLCTAGREIGNIIRKHMDEGDLLTGYIYDIIGSEIAESAADHMHDSLEAEMKKTGLGISNRFSPGYCGWDVSEQHKLFSLVPGNFCGITLTDSALMEPIKSVSGIIAIGKDVQRKPYTCNRCDIESCIYRNRQ